MNKILNHEHKKISEWINAVHFKKKFIGGVDEQDVWEKIEELNEMYEKALSAERVRYDALLSKQRRSSSLKPGTPRPVQKERE